jgi:hypothetical protein
MAPLLPGGLISKSPVSETGRSWGGANLHSEVCRAMGSRGDPAGPSRISSRYRRRCTLAREQRVEICDRTCYPGKPCAGRIDWSDSCHGVTFPVVIVVIGLLAATAPAKRTVTGGVMPNFNMVTPRTVASGTQQ